MAKKQRMNQSLSSENKLDSLILLYCPSVSEIDQIVQSQQLFVGRTVAKSIDGPAMIEDEVVALLTTL